MDARRRAPHDVRQNSTRVGPGWRYFQRGQLSSQRCACVHALDCRQQERKRVRALYKVMSIGLLDGNWAFFGVEHVTP